MKKILIILLLLHASLHTEQKEEDPYIESLEYLLSDTQEDSDAQRLLPPINTTKVIPTVNFARPLVFNPNSTPYPTQPAQITDIRNLIVYVNGAQENGPFGSSQNAINQINAINNNNIGFVNVMNLIFLQAIIANQLINSSNPNIAVNGANGSQSSAQQSASQQSAANQGAGLGGFSQSAAQQSASQQSAATQGANSQSTIHNNATSQLNITQLQNTASSQTNLQYLSQFANITPNQVTNQVATQKINSFTNQLSSLTPQQIATITTNQAVAITAAGIASSGLNATNFGNLSNGNNANQLAALQAGLSSTTNSSVQPNQANQANSNTTNSTGITTPKQSTLSNPNPFITINNPVLTPKAVVWQGPLIIDNNNRFFDTQSTITFQENVIYDPGQNYTYPVDYQDYPAAIIVAKDDITINLNGFNLSLAARSATNPSINRPVHGISIMPGVNNLKIISSTTIFQTGSISDFSGYGIYGKGLVQSFSNNIHENLIQNVFIQNLLIYNNLGGISLSNVLQTIIDAVAISYSFGIRDTYGIVFNYVLNGAILDSKINQNYSTTGNVIGISMTNTVNTVINNCAVDNNRTLRTTSTIGGNSTGILITSTTGYVSRDNKVQNTSVVGNICAYATGNQCAGIIISGGSSFNFIDNCTIASNAYGPVFPGVAPTTYGILIDSPSLQNIINNNNVGYHTSYGIIDTSTLSSSLFTRNVCIFNGTNYSATVVTGAGPTTGPLPSTVVYPGDLTAYTGGGPVWQNVEVLLS